METELVTGLRRLSVRETDAGRLIAGLIDGELERRSPTDDDSWIAQHLGVSEDDLYKVHELLSGIDFELFAYAVGELLDRAVAVEGLDGSPTPGWATLTLPDRRIALPAALRVVLPAGIVTDTRVGLRIAPNKTNHMVTTYVPKQTSNYNVVDDLRAQVIASNPWRGRVLQLDASNLKHQLEVDVVATPTGARSDLILPGDIWADVDRNTTGLLRNRGALERLGLGLNRGLLLHGPPGTGKTQLVRTLVGELAGLATCVLPTPAVLRDRLPRVYKFAQQFAPAIVVLEDVDLIASRRKGAANEALVDLLTTIDGLMTHHDGVITLATTNDPHGLDDAAVRTARFDRIIEIPPPPLAARRLIWTRYLDGLDGPFDIDRLAHATASATGADIRELVRHAILDTDGHPTTEGLLELARRTRFDHTPHGQYL